MIECSECGHVGCVDCDCRCTAAITGRTVEFASAEFDHYPVGDPDEIRLGRTIQDIDAGDLT